MKIPQYFLEHGSYYLYEVEMTPGQPDVKKEMISMTDTIAIAFDKESGTLHKHGKPEYVNKWFKETRDKFLAAGFDNMADDLIVIEGNFPVEEVNKCITNSNYISVFWKKLNENKITPMKLT